MIVADTVRRTFLHRIYRDDFVRHGALVFVGSTLGNVGGYVYHVALSRQLGPERYGELLSLISLLMIAGVPAGVVTTVVARYAAEFHALDDRGHLRGLVEWIARIAVVGGLILLAVGSGLMGFIARYLHLSTSTPIFFALIAAALAFLGPVMRAVLQGCHRFSGLSGSMAVEGIGKAIFGIGAVAMGWGVVGAVGGFAAGSLVGFLLTMALLRSELGERARFAIDPRRLIETTIGVGGSNLAITGLMTVDIVLARHYLPATQMGYYAAASLIGRTVLYLLGFVPGLVIPKASALHARGESAAGILRRALLLTSACSLIAVLGVGLFPTLTVRIVAGLDFLPAAHFALAYSVAMTLLAATSIVASYRTSLHRFGYVVPLLGIVIAEIVALAIWHTAVSSFLIVLMLANAVAFAVVLIGVHPGERVDIFGDQD